KLRAIISIFCLGALLIAAAPRNAPPKPAPTPSASPTPAYVRPALPIVIVYPFGVSSDMKADIGARAAELFVAQMNGAGGIDAIAAPPTVLRPDYLTYARSISADYYVTGYM